MRRRAAYGWLMIPLILAADWSRWRGPNSDGTSPETGLPVKWSAGSGITWQRDLPPGASTPVIWGDALFVTAQSGERLLLIRLDAATGKEVWTRDVATGKLPGQEKGARWQRGLQKYHKLHNHASPSCETDGKHVAVHFGTGDLAVYDMAGAQLWKRNLQSEYGQYTDWWGHANSPMLYRDTVISACMNDNLRDIPGAKQADSYLIAHDLKTGTVKWKTPRDTGAKAEECDSYATPLLRRTNGREELVIMGGNWLDAYDPATGKQLWKLELPPRLRVITGPVLAGERIICTLGRSGEMLAVEPKGAGTLGESAIRWRIGKNTPDTPWPAVHDGLVFWATDQGFGGCADVATGEVKWLERLGGDYKASPLVADGKVYFLNVEGKTTVVKAGMKFEKLAENKLDDEFVASPIAAGGRVYLRGKKGVYCLD